MVVMMCPDDYVSPTPSPQNRIGKKKKINKSVKHQELAIAQTLEGFPPKWRLTDASLLQVERIRKDRNWLRRRNFILFLYETTAYRPSTGSRYNVATAEGLKRRSGDEPTKVAQRLKHSVFGDFYLVRTIVKYL